MDAASSTSPSNETVSLKLPSGEMVDAIVPAGMSDEAVRGLMQQKHPEFFPPSKPPVTMNQARPGFSGQEIPSNRYMIGGEPRQPMGEQLQDEAAGMLHSAARVSTPNIVQQLYKRYKGLPNHLAELPDQAAVFLATTMGDAGEPRGMGRAAEAGATEGLGKIPAVEAEAPPNIPTSPGFRVPPTREPVPFKPLKASDFALERKPITASGPPLNFPPEEPTPKFQIPAPSASKISRPITENPVVGSLVRAMQKSGLPIAERPNLLLKGSGRVNRILGPEEELTGPLEKSLRQARRQREQ